MDDYDDDYAEEGGEEGEEEENSADAIQEGGIMFLSDSDEDNDDEEEEEDEEDSPYLTDAEKRRRLLEKNKAKFEKQQQKAREAPPPIIKRFKGGEKQRINFGDGHFVELRLESELVAACQNAVIFEGLPSNKLASVLISKFLIKGLKLPKIGVVVSDLMPVLSRVSNCQAFHPCLVYGNSKVVVVTSELPVPAEMAPAMTELLLGLQQKLNSPFIFCAESIPKEMEEMNVDLNKEISEADLIKLIQKMCKDDKEDDKDEEKKNTNGSLAVASKFFGCDIDELTGAKGGKDSAEIMYITNDEPTSDKMKKWGFLPVNNAVVGSVTGTLLAESVMTTATVVCLVARYNPVLSDARASIMLVRTMGLLVETNGKSEEEQEKEVKKGKQPLAGGKWLEDFEWLEKKASNIEKQIKKSVKDMGRSSASNAPHSLYM